MLGFTALIHPRPWKMARRHVGRRSSRIGCEINDELEELPWTDVGGVARLVSGALTSGHAGISKECTFESSFVVQVRQRTDRPKTGALQSKPANTSTRQQGPRKTAKPDRTSLASVPERNTTTKEAKPRLTEEEKRERRRARTAARRQRQLELGLCVSCSNEPIEGQTRCPECAERHRQHWQNWQPKRKTAQRDGPPKVPALTD